MISGVDCMQKYVYPRIRDLREDKDLTQEEVAKYLGKQLTTYRRWEAGETEIPTHILKQLCEFYNVSADFIFEFTDTPKSIN